jgi:hypothetical protein
MPSKVVVDMLELLLQCLEPINLVVVVVAVDGTAAITCMETTMAALVVVAAAIKIIR